MTARHHAAAAILLAVLVVVPYAQTLDDEWHFDDLVERTPGVRAFHPKVPAGDYRGIVVLWTWAMDHRLHGEDPAGYHVTNIAVHLANALLVYWITWMLTAGAASPGGRASPRAAGGRARGLGALAAAGIFAAHPLATESVTYLTQRSTSLAAMFLLLSWGGWIAFRRSGRTGFLFLSLAALAVGLYAKHVVVLAPVLIAGTELLMGWKGRRRAFVLLVPFLLLAGWRAVQLAPRVTAAPRVPAASAPRPVLPRYTRAEYALAQTVAVPTYVRLALFPAGQNLDWDVDVPASPADPRTAVLAGLVLGLCGLAWRFRRTPAVPAGIGLFVVALVPTSSVVPSADPMAEHRAYLPLAGLCLAAAPAWGALGTRFPRGAIVLLAALLLGLAAATYRRNEVWDSELSLWSDVAAKSPDKERPHLNLGLALMREGRLDDAEREVRRALEIRPDYAFAHNNLGNLLRRRGHAAEAEEHYRAAIRARPGYAEPYVNLGNLAADRGDWAAAEALYREALSIRPDARDASYNLAKALEAQGRLPEAIAAYRELARRFPDDAVLVNDLGCARLLSGDAEGAERDLSRALEIDGSRGATWYNLGLAREARGDRDGAIRALEEALARAPDLEPARRRLEDLRPD